MKSMHGLVNIVPIIAKADSLTPKELRKLKDTVSCESVKPFKSMKLTFIQYFFMTY